MRGSSTRRWYKCCNVELKIIVEGEEDRVLQELEANRGQPVHEQTRIGSGERIQLLQCNPGSLHPNDGGLLPGQALTALTMIPLVLYYSLIN